METNKFWGSNDVGIGMLHIRCTKCLTVRGHLTYDLMISQLCLFSYFQTGWVIRFFFLLFKVIKVKLKYALVIVSVRLRECSVSISKPHRDYGNTFVCECVTVWLCACVWQDPHSSCSLCQGSDIKAWSDLLSCTHAYPQTYTHVGFSIFMRALTDNLIYPNLQPSQWTINTTLCALKPYPNPPIAL